MGATLRAKAQFPLDLTLHLTEDSKYIKANPLDRYYKQFATPVYILKSEIMQSKVTKLTHALGAPLHPTSNHHFAPPSPPLLPMY